MKDAEGARWLTAEEAMKLEGVSLRTLQRRRWEYGVRYDGPPGENGQPISLYDVYKLSTEAQRKWSRKYKTVEIEPPAEDGHADQQLLLQLSALDEEHLNLPVKDRETIERRIQAIHPFIDPKRYADLWAHCGGRKTAVAQWLAEANGVSVRTIHDWTARWTGAKHPGREGSAAMLDAPRADRGRPRKFNQAAIELMAKILVPQEGEGGYGELNLAEAFRIYQEERRFREAAAGRVVENGAGGRLANYIDSAGRLKDEARLPEASYSTFRRWVERLPEPVLTLARAGVENFSNREVPYSYRDIGKLAPLDFVVMDHRQLDIFCLLRDKRGGWRRVGRPWVTAAMDMRTRRWLAWQIVETPNSDVIASVLKRVFLDFGRPNGFYWDNGGDFECEWLNTVLLSLKIRVTHSIIRRARSKSIEPNFKQLAAFERTLPWWCGHKPDRRPEERVEKLMAEHERWVKGKGERAFQTIDEIGELYAEVFADLNRREHNGQGMAKTTAEGRGWMSPEECWDSLIGSVVRETVPRGTLMFMFRDRRHVKVRHAQIQLSHRGERFIYNPSADDDPLALAPFNGKTVEVAIDKEDLETVAVVWEDRLVCLAQNMKLRGMREEDFKEDEKNRRRMTRQTKALLKQINDRVGVPGTVERLHRRTAEAEQRSEPARPQVVLAYPEQRKAAEALAGRGRGSFLDAAADIKCRELDVDDDGGFDFFGGGE